LIVLVAELKISLKIMEIVDLISDSEEEVIELPQLEAENDEEIDGSKDYNFFYLKAQKIILQCNC